jgi:hypothetical protein
MGGVLVSLKEWKWLKNNGVVLLYAGLGGLEARRFVPAGGMVSLPEAAQILATNEVQLHRLKRAKKLQTTKVRGRAQVPISELLRLRKKPEGLHPGRLH